MTAPLRVLIAGGGVAGLEALLALHDLAGNRVETTLLAPDDDFVYRPLAVGEPFSLGHRERVPLADVARDAGAKLVRDGLDRVDDAQHVVHTTSGDSLRYDALLVATGARTEAAVEHASTWTPDADPGMLGGILRDVEGGYLKRLAFVVPTEAAWPLPAYELALMTAGEAAGMGRDDLELTIVTPEDQPLGLFGTQASEAVRAKLDAAGVRVEAGSYVSESGHGMLRLEPGHRELEVDRVLALPRARGKAVPGLQSDQHGFLPVDQHQRVAGTGRVWAAGDGTTFPIKQGGLAAQEADAAAEAIAALAGAEIEPKPFHPILRGMLMTGHGAQFMRHDVAGGGGEGHTAEHALWWPPVKVGGRYLAPYLAALSDAEALGLEGRPDGLPVELDLKRELDFA